MAEDEQKVDEVMYDDTRLLCPILVSTQEDVIPTKASRLMNVFKGGVYRLRRCSERVGARTLFLLGMPLVNVVPLQIAMFKFNTGRQHKYAHVISPPGAW